MMIVDGWNRVDADDYEGEDIDGELVDKSMYVGKADVRINYSRMMKVVILV